MAKKETVKTEQDYKRMIKNPECWGEVISDLRKGERIMQFNYMGKTAYRLDVMDYGACEWRKKFWYRHGSRCGVIKMGLQQFTEWLEEIDRERENR